MTIYPLAKPNYFLFQDSGSEVSYACERIILWRWKYGQKAIFSFRWYSHNASFLLDTYYVTYNHCKKLLKSDFKLKDAF